MSKKKIAKEKLRIVEDDDQEQLPQIRKDILDITTNMKTDIYRMGELLVKAKKILGHGGFTIWIEENFEFSSQQANNFMNVYRHCLGRPELVKTIKASLLYQITSPGFPDDLREHILSNGKNLKKIKGKEFRKVYDNFKSGKLDLKSKEIKRLFKQNKNKAYEKEIADQITKLKKIKASIFVMTNKFRWPLHPVTQYADVNIEQMKQINELIAEIVGAIKDLKPGLDGQDTKATKLAA
jgi:predicted transcriptional regulator